jgi:hypothetical protein
LRICGYDGAIRIFDADRRLAAITAKGDPLEMIARVVPFESFRAEIEAAVSGEREEEHRRPQVDRRDGDGSDAGAAFAYNLSDEQVEYQVRDRLSCTRFLMRDDSPPHQRSVDVVRCRMGSGGVALARRFSAG